MSTISIGDGVIELDSVCGKMIGFTSERFDVASYLWKIGEYVYVSFIASKKPGNFSALVQEIQGRGWGVKVPTPLGRMLDICQKHGVQTWEPIAEIEEFCEVWILNWDGYRRPAV